MEYDHYFELEHIQLSIRIMRYLIIINFIFHSINNLNSSKLDWNLKIQVNVENLIQIKECYETSKKSSIEIHS